MFALWPPRKAIQTNIIDMTMAENGSKTYLIDITMTKSDSKSDLIEMPMVEHDSSSDLLVEEEEPESVEVLPFTYDGNSTCYLLGTTKNVSTSHRQRFIDPFSLQHSQPERFTSSKVRILHVCALPYYLNILIQVEDLFEMLKATIVYIVFVWSYACEKMTPKMFQVGVSFSCCMRT